jgi:hypothetical protein
VGSPTSELPPPRQPRTADYQNTTENKEKAYLFPRVSSRLGQWRSVHTYLYFLWSKERRGVISRGSPGGELEDRPGGRNSEGKALNGNDSDDTRHG